jgi:hypothetical protein
MIMTIGFSCVYSIKGLIDHQASLLKKIGKKLRLSI